MKLKRKLKKKKVNRRRKGLKVEKLAAELLKKKKFMVWRPPKVMFHSQDIFGLFDLIALSKNELKLIQVQNERKRPYKTKSIQSLPKPKNLSYELWVFRPKDKNFEIFKIK
jgi:hypothetical protein